MWDLWRWLSKRTADLRVAPEGAFASDQGTEAKAPGPTKQSATGVQPASGRLPRSEEKRARSFEALSVDEIQVGQNLANVLIGGTRQVNKPDHNGLNHMGGDILKRVSCEVEMASTDMQTHCGEEQPRMPWPRYLRSFEDLIECPVCDWA
jgi:hypothetical protein